MCGIVGIFALRERERLWPEEAIRTMLQRVRHRGPDGERTYCVPGIALGHARLAVIDLSDAGCQPMFSPDGRFAIIYNGELYNFRQLRMELEGEGHRFRTATDTEVILAAWMQWGEAALERFDGIFAFAMVDFEKRVLTLLRDRLGVKPLFYQEVNGTLFFASEIPALFSRINPCPAEERDDLDVYFTFNYLPAPRTGLTGVRQLSPGSILRAGAHGITISRYWRPEYREELTRWSHDSVDRFREILFDSVRSQMVADVPLGVFLSGGLDSYSVALAAAAGTPPPTAFTLGFAEPGFDESAAAREYADYLQIRGEQVLFQWDEASLARILEAMGGELLADPSCFPMYQLSREARRSVTVALTGDGGDELLAGYDTYRAGMVTPLVRLLPLPLRRLLRDFARFLPSDNQRYGKRMVVERLLDAAAAGSRRDHASFRRIFSDDVKNRLYLEDFRLATQGNDPVGEYAAAMDELPSGRSYLAARLHADLTFHLPSILAQVDRMSMAHGLEVRVPLLGKEMVDFCINLEDACKRPLTGGKRILRSALQGSIPPSGLKRPKASNIPPVDRWFRDGGPMVNIFGDSLHLAKKSLGSLDWTVVERFWQEHRQERVEGGYVLLSVLQYINWSTKCRHL